MILEFRREIWDFKRHRFEMLVGLPLLSMEITGLWFNFCMIRNLEFCRRCYEQNQNVFVTMSKKCVVNGLYKISMGVWEASDLKAVFDCFTKFDSFWHLFCSWLTSLNKLAEFLRETYTFFRILQWLKGSSTYDLI